MCIRDRSDSLHTEDKHSTVCQAHPDDVSRPQLAQPEEDRWTGPRVHVPEDDRGSGLPRPGPSLVPAGRVPVVRDFQASVGKPAEPHQTGGHGNRGYPQPHWTGRLIVRADGAKPRYAGGQARLRRRRGPATRSGCCRWAARRAATARHKQPRQRHDGKQDGRPAVHRERAIPPPPVWSRTRSGCNL